MNVKGLRDELADKYTDLSQIIKRSEVESLLDVAEAAEQVAHFFGRDQIQLTYEQRKSMTVLQAAVDQLRDA